LFSKIPRLSLRGKSDENGSDSSNLNDGSSEHGSNFVTNKNGFKESRIIPSRTILAYEIMILPVTTFGSLVLSRCERYVSLHLCRTVVSRLDELDQTEEVQMSELMLDYIVNNDKVTKKIATGISKNKLRNLLEIAIFMEESALKNKLLERITNLSDVGKKVFLDILRLVSSLTPKVITEFRVHIKNRPSEFSSIEKIMDFLIAII